MKRVGRNRVAFAVAGCVAGAVAACPVSAQMFAPSEGFADLTERLSPAVVNIRASQTIAGGLPRFEPGSPLEQFNDFLGGEARTQSALGSGFVIDADGVIVTNDHVIDDADEIEVYFQDGRTLEARIVGRDPATDLAVLQVVGGHDLPYVTFGDSDEARVGDWVMAIGNPFGIGQTLTVGVISARNRDIDAGSYDDFIQTDAAINTGNSGGPLFNLDGEVIGVNSAILSPTGASVGIGFSIPSELALSIVDQLLEYGETRRGWLGVSVQRVDAAVAETYGLDSPMGALVARVTDDGPAAAAGFERGDLIVSFDGQEVTDDRSLTRMVADAEVGKEVSVEYLRQGRRNIALVTIERLATDEVSDTQHQSPELEAGSLETALGVAVGPLDTTSRRQHRVPSDVDGVIVTYVSPGTDAVGRVRVGDVIEEIAWEKPSSPSEAVELIDAAAASGERVLLLLNRSGQIIFESVLPEDA